MVGLSATKAKNRREIKSNVTAEHRKVKIYFKVQYIIILEKFLKVNFFLSSVVFSGLLTYNCNFVDKMVLSIVDGVY